ncbi:MAG: hypothetical protein ACTHPS_15095 [Streptosporangiaceae bacterium]
MLWHLRDTAGKLVLVHAGELVISTDTGAVLKVTPNAGPAAAAVVCPALGGHPAS